MPTPDLATIWLSRFIAVQGDVVGATGGSVTVRCDGQLYTGRRVTPVKAPEPALVEARP